MMKIKISIYTFDELNENAKAKAIEEHRHFMLETLVPDYGDGVIDWCNPEKMKDYESEYEYILMNNEPVIESIEINEYYFYFDGTLCNATTYTGGPKKGTTEIIIHGETFIIQGEK